MFGSKPPPTPALGDPSPTPPPSLEEVYGAAMASAAYAKAVFVDAVDELIGANVDLDDVVMRAGSEIDRLTQLRDEAAAQRRANTATVEKLQALIG